MKPIFFLLTSFTLGILSFGQDTATYQLQLNNIQIDYKGEKITKNPITITLKSKEEQNINLYTKDGHAYFLNTKILIKGGRIKLHMRNYLVTQEGKVVKGKYRKYVHYLKIGTDNNFSGNGTESLLIDAQQVLAMKVIYKFELMYVQ